MEILWTKNGSGVILRPIGLLQSVGNPTTVNLGYKLSAYYCAMNFWEETLRPAQMSDTSF